MKLIAALVLLLAVASAADLPSDIKGTAIQAFDNGTVNLDTADGLVNVVLAYPVSLPNQEVQFQVLGRDIQGRVVVRPIIEGCSACSAEIYEQTGGVWVQVEYSPEYSPVQEVALELTDSVDSGSSTKGSFDASCYKMPTATEFPRVYV